MLRRAYRWRVMIVGVIGVLSIAGAGAHAVFGATRADKGANNPSEEIYQQLELFTDALALIESDYVEEPKVKDLIYGALKGMLASLDPYSQFLDPDTYREIKVETEGQFGGLGIEITIQDHLLTIISPIDGTPAYKAGVKPGDKIVRIGGELTRDITLLDAVKKLRGDPGTKVTITILREEENKLMDLTITRDIVKIKSIREASMAAEHVAYVRVSEFQEKTPKDLREAINTLKNHEIKGLVLDLRDNPGGLLDVAVEVSGMFLPDASVVVSIEGRLKKQNMVFHSRRGWFSAEIPIVVLLNEGSASASEIVAGAIQDHQRGIVLGTKSFGKGSVQTVIPLRDGSALRLTTSKYFTPNKRSIHGEGIIPDVIVERMNLVDPKQKNSSSEKIFSSIESGVEGDLPETPGDEAEQDKPYDNQLAQAIHLLQGLNVYRP